MEQMEKTRVAKRAKGYNYKYADLAQVHEYLEERGMAYYQYVHRIDNTDYIMTVPVIDGKEHEPRMGVKIVDASLDGKKNAAQEQGSAVTYARRYSLLMAFGLATEDDDGEALTRKTGPKEWPSKNTAQGKKPAEPKDDKTISPIQIGELKTLMLRKGVDFEAISGRYRVNTFEEITESDYAKIVSALNKSKDIANG